MKPTTMTPIAAGILLACGALAAQAEVAGSVLVAVGDATALRQGQLVRLAAGSPIETGDTLRVGAGGNMQVRFTDEAIVALRPNTHFRVEEYAFANKADSDKSVFALLKGGIRTITGLIGRHGRNNYAIKAEAATIGIRGTHYTLVSCRDDYVCRGADGSAAAAGLYGGVTDGRIAVANQAGEGEFGADEYFHVASATAPARSLLAPPAFLRDRLDGRAGAAGQGGQEQAAGGGDAAVSSRLQPVAESPTDGFRLVGTGASEQPAVAAMIPSRFDAYDDFVVAGVVDNEARRLNTLELPAAARAAEVARLKAIYPAVTGMSTDQGYSEAAGQVYWGHWFGFNNSIGGVGEHWALGVPTAAAVQPAGGTYIYNYIGGTRPTDTAGNVGRVIDGGVLALDFISRLISSVKPLLWTVGGHDYSLTVMGGIDAGGASHHVLACGDCANPSAEVTHAATGEQGQGLILGVHTSASFNGVTQETGSAQVYGHDGALPTYQVAGATASADGSAIWNYGDANGRSPYSPAEWAARVAANPGLFSRDFGAGPVAATAMADLGGNAQAGHAQWGVATGAALPVLGVHWGVGDQASNIPTSGSYTYNWVGGTRPVDNFGYTGTVIDGGSLNFDFTSRLGNTVRPFQWMVGSFIYSLALTNHQWGVASSGTVTLNCGYCLTGSATVDSQMTGNGATGFIAGFHTTALYGGFVHETASVQVYGRDAAAPVGGNYPASTSFVEVYADVGNAETRLPAEYGGQRYSSGYSYAWAYRENASYENAPVLGHVRPAPRPELIASSHAVGPTFDRGSDAAAGNLTWNRFSWNISTEYSDGVKQTQNTWDHHISGDAPNAVPTAGVYTFNWIGGTQPTDQNGVVGTLTSGGSWSVDFATKTVATVTPVNWNVNGIYYALSVPSQALSWQSGNTYTAADGSYSVNSITLNPITNVNVGCGAASFCSVNPYGNQVALAFFGNQAQGLGVGYATSVSVGGVDHYTAHVQAYRR